MAPMAYARVSLGKARASRQKFEIAYSSFYRRGGRC